MKDGFLSAYENMTQTHCFIVYSQWADTEFTVVINLMAFKSAYPY